MGYGNDSRQSGHLETLPIDLLHAHLDVSFIFNHLDAMNVGPNFSSLTPPRKKAVYKLGLNHLRRYGRFVANRCHAPYGVLLISKQYCCPEATLQSCTTVHAYDDIKLEAWQEY
jgi:hypothetical protein